MTEEAIECPKCKKRSVYVEHPDDYEVWLKCRECNYFQGMSAAEWHRIHNSPNLDEKIKKMYKKDHGVQPGSDERRGKGKTGHTCRHCGSSLNEKNEGAFGLCKKCCYKIIIIIVVIMVILSYMAWMALL